MLRKRALSIALLVLLLAPAAVAAPSYVIRDQKTAKKLNAVVEFLQADQYAEARGILKSFRLEKMNDYEASLVYQMLGFVSASEENFPEAAEYWEKCLERGGLPPPSMLSTRFNLAQIYMMRDKWDDAIRNLEIWFEQTEAPNPLAYYVLAAAYYQNDQQDKAFTPAKAAVDRAKSPKEAWIQLLLALHMEKKRYKEALPLLVQLVEGFPKKNYWIQIAAVYSELDQDKKALAAQQLAYVQGLLTTDRELTRLAQTYLFQELPYLAAQLMEKGLDEEAMKADSDAFKLLGDSWLAAREFEKSLEPLTRAAELSDDGELFQRIGQVYIQREAWGEAVDALDKALAKGDLKEPGSTHLLLGIARYNLKRPDSARSSFAKARDYEASRPSADRWLDFLAKEAARTS